MTNANEVLGKNLYRVEPVMEPGFDWFVLADSYNEAQDKVQAKSGTFYTPGTKITVIGAVEELVGGIEVGVR